MTGEQHDRGDSGRGNRNVVAHIALELFTVFIGVTLAFAFDGYREKRDLDQRKHQLEHAIINDLASFDSVDSQYVNDLRRGLASFDSLRAAGRRPIPYFFRIGGAERAPSDVWQAAMQSGAGALLDPDVMISAARFYNEISGESIKYVRYAQFTEQRIFPLLDSDTTAFYDASGELKPEFKGHLRQLREIVADLAEQARRAQALHKELTGRLK